MANHKSVVRSGAWYHRFGADDTAFEAERVVTILLFLVVTQNEKVDYDILR